MRFGIISDIHGNLVALKAVLGELDAAGIDRLICLGDVVGYGPDPVECIDTISRCDAITIVGNHEEALCCPEIAQRFNENARLAIDWTHARLMASRPDLLRWVADLPGMVYFGGSIMCVHDTPAPGGPAYILDGHGAAHAFAGVDVPICLLGHTHIPIAFRSPAIGECLKANAHTIDMIRPDRFANFELELDAGARWIINPGSVGQPRDGDVRAACGVLDLERGRFEWLRVEYDIAEAQHRVEAAGLPTASAQRLAIGA